MRESIAASVALHIAVIVIGVVGLPRFHRELPPETPVVVDLVTISDETNVPARPKQPEPKKEEPKPEPPKPEPKVEAPPPSPAKAEPPPQVAAVPPEPKPQPKAEVKKEEPKPEPKPQPPEELSKTRPAKKPKAPKQDFDAVLKNLAKSLPQQQKPEPKAEKKPSPSFDEMMAKAVQSNRRSIGDPSKPITMTQKDAIQNEFNKAMQRCWNVPAGARDAANLVITVKANLAPDGSIIQLRSDDVRSSDPFRRAAAESAVRALQICSPYSNLPSIAGHDQWRDLELTFNPKQLLGG